MKPDLFGSTSHFIPSIELDSSTLHCKLRDYGRPRSPPRPQCPDRHDQISMQRVARESERARERESPRHPHPFVSALVRLCASAPLHKPGPPSRLFAFILAVANTADPEAREQRSEQSRPSNSTVVMCPPPQFWPFYISGHSSQPASQGPATTDGCLHAMPPIPKCASAQPALHPPHRVVRERLRHTCHLTYKYPARNAKPLLPSACLRLAIARRTEWSEDNWRDSVSPSSHGHLVSDYCTSMEAGYEVRTAGEDRWTREYLAQREGEMDMMARCRL